MNSKTKADWRSKLAVEWIDEWLAKNTEKPHEKRRHERTNHTR